MPKITKAERIAMHREWEERISEFQSSGQTRRVVHRRIGWTSVAVFSIGPVLSMLVCFLQSAAGSDQNLALAAQRVLALLSAFGTRPI